MVVVLTVHINVNFPFRKRVGKITRINAESFPLKGSDYYLPVMDKRFVVGNANIIKRRNLSVFLNEKKYGDAL